MAMVKIEKQNEETVDPTPQVTLTEHSSGELQALLGDMKKSYDREYSQSSLFRFLTIALIVVGLITFPFVSYLVQITTFAPEPQEEGQPLWLLRQSLNAAQRAVDEHEANADAITTELRRVASSPWMLWERTAWSGGGSPTHVVALDGTQLMVVGTRDRASRTYPVAWVFSEDQLEHYIDDIRINGVEVQGEIEDAAITPDSVYLSGAFVHGQTTFSLLRYRREIGVFSIVELPKNLKDLTATSIFGLDDGQLIFAGHAYENRDVCPITLAILSVAPNGEAAGAPLSFLTDEGEAVHGEPHVIRRDYSNGSLWLGGYKVNGNCGGVEPSKSLIARIDLSAGVVRDESPAGELGSIDFVKDLAFSTRTGRVAVGTASDEPNEAAIWVDLARTGSWRGWHDENESGESLSFVTEIGSGLMLAAGRNTSAPYGLILTFDDKMEPLDRIGFDVPNHQGFGAAIHFGQRLFLFYGSRSEIGVLATTGAAMITRAEAETLDTMLASIASRSSPQGEMRAPPLSQAINAALEFTERRTVLSSALEEREQLYQDARIAFGNSNEPGLTTSLVSRLAYVGLFIFLIQTVNVLHRYHSKRAAYYDGRCAVIRLMIGGKITKTDQIAVLTTAFSGEAIEFGKGPSTLADRIVDTLSRRN